MTENKIIIIFSGYNDRAVVSFIRTLVKNRIDYVVIARNDKDPIFKTEYRGNVVITRESQNLNLGLIKKYIEIIQNKSPKVTHYFIAPSTETLNRFLQKERAALEKMNVIVSLAVADVYVSVSDKILFGEVCRKSGIMVPAEYDSIVDTVLPFVAKPKKYFAQNGSIYAPFLIFSKEQKELFMAECDLDDFYFQKYLEGRSIYLLYYFHRNGQVIKFSQENLIQQPDGKSIVAAVSSDFHNTAESMKYEKLFTMLGFNGLVMVEVNVNKEGNTMIEANPRFWGPSQLFVDAGINFFEAYLHDYGFIDNAPIFRSPKKTKYFWFGGVQSVFSDNKQLFFHESCEEDFLVDLDDWIHHDVFKRIDTIKIFKREMI